MWGMEEEKLFIPQNVDFGYTSDVTYQAHYKRKKVIPYSCMHDYVQLGVDLQRLSHTLMQQFAGHITDYSHIVALFPQGRVSFFVTLRVLMRQDEERYKGSFDFIVKKDCTEQEKKSYELLKSMLNTVSYNGCSHLERLWRNNSHFLAIGEDDMAMGLDLAVTMRRVNRGDVYDNSSVGKI